MKRLLISVSGIIGLFLVSLVAFLYPINPATEKERMVAVMSSPYPTVTVSIPINSPERIQPTEKPSGVSKKNSYLLMKIAMAEAEDEDTEGKALVMRVVLNRVKSSEFPNTIKKVIYQDKQFSPIANGRFDRVEPNKDCRLALNMIQKDGWDESMGALYFESKSASTWHEDNLQFLFKHGNHYFYKNKEDLKHE